MTEKDPKRPIPLWLALAPLVMLIAMLSTSVILFHDNAGYGPNQVALMLAAGTAAVIGLYLGFSWHDMEAVSYTHLTLPTNVQQCRSRWSPYH